MPITIMNLFSPCKLIKHKQNNKYFESSIHVDLVSINFNELIPKDKIRKKDSKNMSVLQNDVRSTSSYVKILIDSGANLLIIPNSVVYTNKFNTRKTSVNKWSTMAGSFSTSCEAEVKMKFPE